MNLPLPIKIDQTVTDGITIEVIETYDTTHITVEEFHNVCNLPFHTYQGMIIDQTFCRNMAGDFMNNRFTIVRKYIGNIEKIKWFSEN